MKIGIFTNNYLPNPYGVSGSIESFRIELERKGHSVYIFAPEWKGYEDENPNVFRYPSIDIKVKFRFPLAIPHSKKIEEVLKFLDLDIIHSQHPNLLGLAAKKWAKEKKIPLIFTWHTLYDRYMNYIPFVPKKLASQWIIKNAVKYANSSDLVIAPTDSAKKIIIKYGVKKEIKVAATGIEEYLFASANGERVRKEYGLKGTDNIILTVSRLSEEKNVNFLFDAIYELLKKDKSIKLVSVGGGYLQEELFERAKKMNVSRQVYFAGEIEREGMKDYYDAADMFAYASKSETQGMIISEAMYMGLPVVALDASGIRDQVLHERSGFLVKNENKDKFIACLDKLINDDQLRNKFSESAKKIAKEQYTAKICTDRLLEIYKNLLDESFK